MMYQYSIEGISEAEHWIFVSSDDELDTEEPDSFVFLMKKIRDRVDGHIVEVDEMCYGIPEDGMSLRYQWDTLFGITVIYPESTPLEKVTSFLLSIFSQK